MQGLLEASRRVHSTIRIEYVLATALEIAAKKLEAHGAFFVREMAGSSFRAGLEVHLVMDNYGTHKVAKVRNWLARHPRYRVHFTPTGASWLNLVERLEGCELRAGEVIGAL